MEINLKTKWLVLLVLLILSASPNVVGQNFTKKDSLLKVLSNSPKDSTRVLILLNLLDGVESTDTSTVNFYLKRITEELENNKITVSASQLYSLGLLYEEKTNDLLQAAKYYELAIQEAKEANNTDWILYEGWLGYTLTKTGDNEKALFHLLRATEETESRNWIIRLPRAYTLLAFGYREVKDYPKSELYFNKVIEASLKVNDSTYIHTALHELGNLYSFKNDIKMALLYHKQALQIREKLQQPNLLVYSYHDIAHDYLKSDSLETALSYYYKAEYYSQKNNDTWMILVINKSIVGALLTLKEFKNAEERILKIQKLAEQLNIKTAYFQLYDSWYAYYRATGQFEKALNYYEKAKVYNDSISNEQIQKNILELDKKYETAKKDKELIENQGHIKRQQIVIQFVILGSVIIAFFLILVIIQFRQKKAANVKLEIQNQEILSQKEELKTQSENLLIINNQLTEQRNEIEGQREKLFELNATKDKFFSIMAHDLKNPFNSLLGMSELLSLNAFIFPPEKVLKYAQIMHSSSKQAYTLLENLLSWSRLQTGTLTPKFSNEKPSSLIGEIKMLLDAAAQSKGIYLISDVIDDDPIVADIEMTKTVLRNLVTNALKFTFPDGTVKIECEKHENEMVFGVTDTGIGIEPEHINKLFRIESKLSKNGTAEEKGTGLGLILCKEFVEKQHGRIWVQSETGKGSCFSFTIPLITDGQKTN